MNSINKLKLNFKTNMKSLHQCTSDVHHNLNLKILLFLMLFAIKTVLDDAYLFIGYQTSLNEFLKCDHCNKYSLYQVEYECKIQILPGNNNDDVNISCRFFLQFFELLL